MKKGKKYLMYVSGLTNPDSTLVSETLKITGFIDGVYTAEGCATGHLYSINEKEFKERRMKSNKGFMENFEKSIIILIALILSIFGGMFIFKHLL